MSAQSRQIPQLPHIRCMQPVDLGAVMEIERQIYPFPWTRGNFSDSIAAGYDCLVLEQGDSLTGYGVMMMGPGEAHILNLSIAACWQRQGWGGRLLQHFIQLARTRHAHRMLLEVRQSNPAALRLYERAGFSRIAARKDYYPAAGGREDAIIMELAL